MQRDAMLTQLGYAPNKALVNQLKRIEENTIGYEKIQKHIKIQLVMKKFKNI